MKAKKMKEHFVWGGGGRGAGLNLASLKMCFPFPGLGHEYQLKVILRQHYRIILAASLEKIYSRVMGGVATIRLIVLKYKTLVCKKNCKDVFFLPVSYLAISTFKS